MRLHKSEAAFFIFIAVNLAAGVMIFHAYDVLFSVANGLTEPGRYEDIAYLSKLGKRLGSDKDGVVCLSGRGDKDMETITKQLGGGAK